MTDAPHDTHPGPARLGLRARLATLRGSSLLHGLLLGLFALVTSALLSGSDTLTRAAIAAREAEDLQASLTQVIPPALHDNDLAADLMRIEDADEGPVEVHIARRGGAVTGLAFELTGYGYSGAIRVLIGMAPDGTILGARVLAHAETPGLGDKIEEAKGDWIHGFDGRSLTDPAPAGWKVRKDGGSFDQFSGATITPRAVVGTVYRALTFFDRNRATLTAQTGKETG